MKHDKTIAPTVFAQLEDPMLVGLIHRVKELNEAVGNLNEMLEDISSRSIDLNGAVSDLLQGAEPFFVTEALEEHVHTMMHFAWRFRSVCHAVAWRNRLESHKVTSTTPVTITTGKAGQPEPDAVFGTSGRSVFIKGIKKLDDEGYFLAYRGSSSSSVHLLPIEEVQLIHVLPLGKNIHGLGC